MNEITICFFDGECLGNEQKDQSKRTMRAAYKLGDEETVIFDVPYPNRSNNVAEYAGLIGLLDDIAFRHTRGGPLAGRIVVQGDSLLVVNQMRGEWRVRSPNLEQFHRDALSIIHRLPTLDFEFRWIPRETNVAGKALE